MRIRTRNLKCKAQYHPLLLFISTPSIPGEAMRNFTLPVVTNKCWILARLALTLGIYEGVLSMMTKGLLNHSNNHLPPTK